MACTDPTRERAHLALHPRERDPEPSGYEGLADVRIMEGIRISARTGRLAPIQPVSKEKRPDLEQAIHIKPRGRTKLVNAQPPSK